MARMISKIKKAVIKSKVKKRAKEKEIKNRLLPSSIPQYQIR